MGNVCSHLLKHVHTYIDIEKMRRNQSLYNSNVLESQYLVWPHLFSSTAWTLFKKQDHFKIDMKSGSLETKYKRNG